MTDTNPTAPKPKRKQARRKKPAARPALPKTDELAGISATDCCAACNANRCVISGIGICAHPLKGGLQASLMSNLDAMARYARAKKALAKAKLDLRE